VRERRRDALWNGDTPLPRRLDPKLALALSALTVALVLLAGGNDARAQSPPSPLQSSPFRPSLTDPRSQPGLTPDRTPPATPSTIVPPSGAGETGFQSTAAPGRKKKPKPQPGTAHPEPPPPPPAPGPPQFETGQTLAQQIPARAPYADAYRPPDAPPRRPAPVPKDAYEPLGIEVGTFLVKPSVEVSRGYDSNASRVPDGKPSAYTLFEPALKLQSQWSRHEYGLDLRGSYSSYDADSSLNRPMLDAKSHTRIDVTHDLKIDSESRFLLSTDYPGSPNLPVGFETLPVFTSYGSSLGLTRRFNRLELSVKGTVDQTRYEDTKLLDGQTSSNQDRDFDQYGGALRGSYEVVPGVKPFAEISADTREHEMAVDRDGFRRDSRALTPKLGTTFDLARRLTGEVSVGYLMRRFVDPGLQDLRGVVADASLVWNATGLTTATLTARSTGEETVVPGVSGVLRRDLGVQVDHALRRWLIWTVRAGYGLDDYVGSLRNDKRLSLGTALTYKLSRELWLKGEYRYDQLRSNTPGADYSANVFLIGLKLQR
jgi:hypothetical protein